MVEKNRIGEALRIRNMRQVELCEKTGLKKSSVNCWIKQKYQPKQIPLLKMARALEVSELWLAGYDVPMERPIEQVKADELSLLISNIKINDDLRELFISICDLNSEQILLIKSMVAQLISSK